MWTDFEHVKIALISSSNSVHFHRRMKRNVDSIVLGQAAGVEHVSFYSPTELLILPYNEPGTFKTVS